MLLLKNKVYMYTFNHHSTGNPWPEWSGDAPHGFEIDHVFGVPFRDNTYSADERTLSGRIITFWTNFAKTGYVTDIVLPHVVSIRRKSANCWSQPRWFGRVVVRAFDS